MRRLRSRSSFSFTLLVLLLFCALTSASTAYAADWYVDDSGDDGGTGTPGDPFRTITHAISVAGSGDTIHIGDGTYDAAAGEAFPLYPRDGVTLQGAGYDQTLLVGDDAYQIMHITDDLSAAPTIRDLCISHGYSEGSGGGVYVSGVPASFFDVWFDSNRCGGYGGGVSVDDAPATFEHCIFESNGGGSYGGGLDGRRADVEVVRCTFRENTTDSGGHGGGVALDDCDAHLDRCLFARNSAGAFGGGVYFGPDSDGALMERCRLERNEAREDGGGGGAVAGLDASFTMRNCVVADNDCDATVDGRGGAVHLCDGSVWHEPEIVNNTFTANSAPLTDGIWCGALVNATIANCILWDGGDELFGCTATFSDIQGGGGASGGCITTYPMFQDPAIEDYGLAPRSPCIDSGANGVAPLDDIRGVLRPQDGNNDVVLVADMGAYEYMYAPTTLYVRETGDDLTGNGTSTYPFRSVTRALGVCLSGDTIDVGAGTFDAAHGESFPIELEDGVEVRGAGSGSTDIVGDGTHGICHAGPAVAGAALRGCRLVHGRAAGPDPRGGGLRCDGGDLDVEDVHIHDCQADDGAGHGAGGGIYCGPGSDVRCRGVVVGGPDDDVCVAGERGGGLCVDGPSSRCDLDDCDLDDCHTGGVSGGGAYYGDGAAGTWTGSRLRKCSPSMASSAGGGLRCTGGSQLDIHDTEFDTCGLFQGYGGAISCDHPGSRCDVDNAYIHDGWAGGYGGGGGISYTAGATGTVSGSRIERNGAWVRGGGVLSVDSSVSVEGCDVSDNSVITDDPEAIGGAGIACVGGACVIDGNDISGNVVADTSGQGGGIYCEGSTTTITDNTIHGNDGGGGGGGVSCNHDDSTVERCRIYGNTAQYGGGANAYECDPWFINDIFYENTGIMAGGGIYGDDQSGSTSDNARVLNCTITGNTSPWPWGDGVSACANASVVIQNSIVWGNGDRELYEDGGGASVSVTYSDVLGGWPGTGNVDVPPMYRDPAGDDYRIAPRSPCVDAGTNAGAPTEDCDGGPRPLDGDNNGSPITDMGASEYLFDEVTIYVRQTGSDLWGSGTAANPFRSVNRGYAQCLDGVGDACDVGPGTYDTAHGESFPIELKAGVDLDGAGPDDTHIVGDDAHGVCHVGPAVSGTTVRGCSLSHGRAARGGGICCDGGDLDVEDVHIHDCDADDGLAVGEGGGIYCGAGCAVRCRGVEIGSCTARERGGGVCCDGGSLDLEDGHVHDCDSGGGGGGGACYAGGAAGGWTGSRAERCDSDGDGGGIRCHGGSQVSLRDTEIGHCTASGRGGGVCCDGPGSRCDTEGGRIHDCDGGGGGGGACYDNDCDGDLDRTRIDHCTTVDEGGGIRCDHGASPHIDECRVSACGNIGIYCDEYCTSIIESCTIEQNTNSALGGWGGNGISIHGQSTCLVVNCVIADNVAAGPWGVGGAWVQDCLTPGAGPYFVNDTFVGNHGEYAGGLAHWDGPGLVVWNCVFWDDPAYPDVHPDLRYPPTTVSYSDVRGGYGGTGNIDEDPLFVDLAGGDYHLGASSPCVDVASDTLLPKTDNDCDLVFRPQDGDFSGGGGGGGGVRDMGAYERTYLALDGGVTHTGSSHIAVESDFVGAVEMRLRNAACDWCESRTYTGKEPWTLNIGGGTFGGRTDYAAGMWPYSVAVADFDGDGDQDLATVDNAFLSWSVDVLIGDGSGGFSAPTDFATSQYSRAVATGDFDDDGRPDLVTAHEYVDELQVRLNTSSGGALSFAPQTQHATGEGPYSVAVGDLDGDGRKDLATANAFGDSVSVLLGDGSGGFAARTDHATGGTPYSVAVADFDGDGDLDLVTANLSSSTVSVLLGDGSGGFGARTDYAAGSAPYSVAVADFDGDGDRDLVTANSGSGNVSVLLGDGSGGFGAKTDFDAGLGPYAIAASDLDGDGTPDVVTANHSSGTASVLLGDGTGGLAPKTDLATGPGPCSVAVGDFDEDGRADLVTTSDAAHTASVLLGQGTSDGVKTVEVEYTYTTQKGLRTLRPDDSIVFDSVPPETTDDAPGEWKGIADVPVDVSLSATDHGGGTGGPSGVAGTLYDIDGAGLWPAYGGVPIAISTEGEHTIDYYSTDNVGNEEIPHPSATVRVDLTEPTVSQSGGDDDPFGDEWHADDVQVILNGSDSGGSGLGGMDGTSDGGTHWLPSPITVPAPPDGSNDGEHALGYRAWDNAGNYTPLQACWVRIDTQPPETTDDSGPGWSNVDVPVTLTAFDTHSGILKTEYQVDEGYWRRGTSLLVAAPLDGSNDGRHTIDYRSVDRALNIEEETRASGVRIDTKPPETTDDYDGLPHSSFLLVFTASDPPPPSRPGEETSGVALTEYSIDGSAWLAGDSLMLRTRHRQKAKGLTAGEHLIEYRSTDLTGNVEATHSCVITLE